MALGGTLRAGFVVCLVFRYLSAALLPILRFMLDEKFQRKSSKFAKYYTYENPNLLFLFFLSCYFIFLPNKCPSLCRHRPGHSLVKNIK